MRARRRGWALLMIPAALAISGCGGDESETPYERLETVADTAGAADGPGAVPVVPTQGGATVGGPLTATGQFEGSVEGAPPGSITLSESGAGTQVSVKLDRYSAGSQVQLSFSNGRCDQPGTPVLAVEPPIETEANGFATTVRQVDIPILALLDGRHSARLRDAGTGQPDIVLACANLPAVPQ